MVLLGNAGYIKNPYLKSKLVEVRIVSSFYKLDLVSFHACVISGLDWSDFWTLRWCFYNAPFGQGESCPITNFLLHWWYFVQFRILTNLDVEQTGMHSQFYEKFSIRYNISAIFKTIWNDPGHRQMFIKESRYVASLKANNIAIKNSLFDSPRFWWMTPRTC